MKDHDKHLTEHSGLAALNQRTRRQRLKLVALCAATLACGLLYWLCK